jgi:glycosyltransferase involved in cell wall biosynthesis
MPAADLATPTAAPRRAAPIAAAALSAPRRRVVLLAQSLNLGGSERQLAEVARALDRRRFEPIVACFNDDGMRADELRDAGVAVVEFPVRSFRAPATARIASSFFRWLRAREIAVVHPFDVPTVLFAVPIARAARVPVVLTSQRGDRRLFPAGFQHGLRLTDRLADAIVVNSEYIRGRLMSDFGVAGGRIRTCPNGVDTSRFRPDGATHRTELPAGAVTIGIVSALRPEKSIETLVEAFARLERRNAHLVVVGDGPCKPDLESLAHRLGIGGRCSFVPGTPDVPAWYRTLDVFVLPSLNESFSNALMEAMASGCAVVASRVGGNPELVDDGGTGLLFEAGNAADLARQLERLARDMPMRRRLAAAAVRRLRDGYATGRSAARVEALYEELLACATAR